MAVVYRDKSGKRVKKDTAGAQRKSYSPTTGKNLTLAESKSRTDLKKSSSSSAPDTRMSSAYNDNGMSTAQPQMSLDPQQAMSLDPAQNMSIPQEKLNYFEQGLADLKQRFSKEGQLQDLYASTGIKAGGYEPDPNMSFTAPMAIPSASMVKPVANVLGRNVPKSLSALENLALEAKDTYQFLPKIGAKPTVGKLTLNTKNAKIVAGYIKKVGVITGMSVAALLLAEKYISTKVFAGFIGNEAGQTSGFTTDDAIMIGEKTGDWTLANELTNATDELFAPENMSWIQKLNPFKPYVDASNAVSEHDKIQQIQNEINKEVIRIKQEAQANGETESEMWARIRQERIDDEIASNERYLENQQRLLEMKAQAESNNRKEEAAFWEEQRRLALKQQEKLLEMKKEYWLALEKKLQKQREEATPSKLNFGMI